MEKLDISKNKLVISEYVETRKGFLNGRHIDFQKPRFCDGLIFILDGSCVYTFDDGMKFEAKKFDILYLAKDALYEMDVNCHRYEFFVINFNFLSDEKRKSAVYPAVSPSYVNQLFSRLCYFRDSDSAISFSRKMELIYKIVGIVAQSSERAYIQGSSREQIELCADRIHMSFADKELSVASLASEAGFSEVYFRKLFLRRFGQSPSKYIMQTRVSHAIKLMEFDGLTLSEIAEECGFSSTPYFNRVFKAVTGESPAAYRRSMAKLPHIT